MQAQQVKFDNEPEQLLPPKSAAAYCAVSEATVRRWILHRMIETVKFDGSVRIRKRALDAFVAARTRPAVAEVAQ